MALSTCGCVIVYRCVYMWVGGCGGKKSVLPFNTAALLIKRTNSDWSFKMCSWSVSSAASKSAGAQFHTLVLNMLALELALAAALHI